MAFEYKRNRNKVTSETDSPKFTYTRDLEKRKAYQAQKTAIEAQKKREEQQRLANFQSSNKAMDFFLADKRPELKNAGASQILKTMDEYQSYLDERNKLLDLDVSAEYEKADRLQSAVDYYDSNYKPLADYYKHEIETLQRQAGKSLDENFKKGVQETINHLENELAGLSSLSPAFISRYGLDINEVNDEYIDSLRAQIENTRKDARYAEYVQLGDRLTKEAQAAADFETRNVYGKKQSQGIDAVKAYLLRNFPDLNMRNIITDPEHEWLGGREGESVFDRGHDFFDAMTEEQRKVLGYYIATNTDKAADYVKSLEEEVGAVVAKGYAKSADDWYDKLLFAASAGVDQFASGVKGIGSLITGDTDYQPATPIQQGSSVIRQDIENAEGFGNRVLGLGYDVVQNTANMAPSLLVGMVSPTAGAVLMGTTAGGNAYTEMINEGGTWAQAAAYGSLVGASETTLERLLGGVVGKEKFVATLMPKLKKAASKVALKIGENVISEFSEESLQTVLEPFFKSLVTGTDYEVPDLEEVIYSGLLGAISGGMFSGANVGGKSIANTVIERAQNAQIQSNLGESILNFDTANEDIKKLIDNAQQSGDKKLQKAANKVAKTEKDGIYDVSARKVGRLAQMSKEQLVQSLMDTATGNDLKSQTIEKLTKSGMNQKGAERAFYLIARDASRGSESKELQSLISKNPDIRTMYDNMVEYLSEEAVTKRVEDVAKASPVTEISNRIVDQRLKDAGIEVIDEATVEKDDVVDVDHVDEDGIAYVKTESGKVIPYKSDSLSISSASHKKMGYASLFGTNGAKTYFALAPETESSRYMNDFTNLYNKGAKGESFSIIESNISEDVQKAIYEAGKADRDAAIKSRQKAETEAKEKEASFVKKQMGFKSDRVALSEEAVAKIKSVSDKGISDQYKAAVKVIDGLAKMLQVNINIVASETDANGNYIGARGMYNRATNTFTFDIMSGMDNVADISYSAMIKTAGHELTHFIQNWSPSKYLTLKNTTLKFLKDQNDAAWITERLDEIRSNNEAIGKNLTLEQAKDELVADAFEDVLSNIDFAETILRTDKTLFDKIHSWVKKNVNDFKKNLGIAVKDVEASSDAAKEMRKAGERAQALYNQWADAFSTALENSTSGQTDVDSDVQNQARKSYLLELDKWDQKTTGFSFVVGYTSDALMKANLPFKQIRIDASKVKATIEKHDGMNIDVFKQLPDLLENPIVVLDSKTEKNSKVVLGDLYDDSNKIVTVALLLTPTSKKGNVLDFMKISTAQGRSHIKSLFEYEDGTSVPIRYIDEKRIQNWLNVNRLQLPLRSSNMDSIKTIPQESSSVKENISDTQAQARKKTRFDVSTRLDLIETAKKNKIASDAASKGLILEYQRNLRSYQAAETTWRIARYHKDTDAIVAAATAMQLRRNTIASIECTKVFAELFGKLDIPYLVEETSAENGLSETALQNAKEAVKKARQALSEAERDAIEWARRIDVAGQRVYDASMRRMRLENSQALNSVQNRIKQAMDKPNTRSSIPVGGKPLAEAIMRTAKELNKLMSSKSKFSPEAETIALIKEAAVIGAGGDVRTRSVNTQDSINIVDEFGSKFKAEFKALTELYGNTKESKNLSFMYDEEIYMNLDQYSADKPDYDDVWSYIFDCARLVRAVAYDLTNANTIMVNKRAESYLELRGGLEYDFMHYAPKKMRKALVNAASSIALTPEVFIHAVFGHTESANKFNQIYDDGQNKYIDVVLAARGLFAEIEEMTDKNGKKLYGEANKKKLLSNEATIDLHMYDGDGNKVFTNEDHAISFILAAKNADYRRHIMYGGWAIPDLEKANKGKNAYLDGRTTEHILDGENDNGEIIEYVTVERGGKQVQIPRIDFTMIDNMRAEANRFQAIGEIDKAIDLRCKLALANQEIKKIESDWEKKILEAARLAERHLSSYANACMQKLDIFYNNVAKTFLDEATEERYGFKKTLEKNHYYPIQVVKEQATQAELNTLVKQDYRVSALGSMKRRVRSRISCKLYGAVSSFAYNVENTAKYYGYLNTLNYIKKITGVSYDKMTDEKGKKKQTKEDIVTLGSYINRNLGNTVFTDYLYTLESDISGGKGMTTAADKALDFIYSGFVANALFFNISPTAKQLSALPLVYPDAGLSASIKGIIKGATTKGDAKGKTKFPMGLTEAQKRYVARYSRIYKYRSGGLVDADLSDFKQSNHPIARVMSKHPTLTGTNWMERTDSQVLGLQFYAILESVKKSNPNLSAQEAATKAGEILDKTIQHFQANSTVLQRAPLLRSKGSTGMSLARVTIGTFKSQQLTMLNAKIDSLLKVATLENQIKELEKSNKREDAEKLKSLKSELSRSKKYAARVAAATMVSYIINAAFTVAIQLIYKRIDDEDDLWEIYGWDLLQSYMSIVPGVGDAIYYLIEQLTDNGYYGDSFAEVGLLGVINDLFDVIGSIGDGEYTVDRVAKDIGKLVAPFGVAARNVWNIVKAIFKWVGVEIE